MSNVKRKNTIIAKHLQVSDGIKMVTNLGDVLFNADASLNQLTSNLTNNSFQNVDVLKDMSVHGKINV